MTDWQEFYSRQKQITVSDFQQAAPWQQQLAEKILEYSPDRVMEAGSGYGQTSYLLARCHVSVTLLDFQQHPLRTAKALFGKRQVPLDLVQGDLLAMPFRDHGFDLVFNSGVLEHLNFSQRCRALAEMMRCVHAQGRVIIAVPNHFSLPYRYGYLYRCRKNQWPYPKEFPIQDLGREIEHLGVDVCQTVESVDRKTAYHFLRRHQRWLFRLLSVFLSFEGYLRILTLEKDPED